MGYEIHIKRDDGREITLDEWCSAVDSTDGVRLATNDSFARNPNTGEQIRIARQPGDAEVYFPDDDAWIPCLWYSPGRISFKAGPGFLDENTPFRLAISAIAAKLNALVAGDDGEIYV